MRLGDATGFEVMRAMIQRVRSQHEAQLWPNTFTIDLLDARRRCRGALVWHAEHGKTFILGQANDSLHGRAGQIYRETTNPEVATGDGHAHRLSGRAPSCATWSSCSSTRPCSTSRAAAAA